MPYIQQIYDEWSAEELVVLAINVGDSSNDVASFMQSNSLSFPVLLDSESEAATRYGIPALPTTIFIDKEGLLQDAKVGAFSSKEEIASILSQLK
jgi:peroxiredoxin